VALAAWYHDAVYDPRAAPPDNEEASVALALRELPRLGVPPDVVAEVARLVRLTAGHHAEPGDHNGALLCDADLAVLAADEAEYDAYAAAVRREYAHVPEDAFRAGRAAVLEQLLALPQLYRLPDTHAAWEARARANLAREVTSLRHSAPTSVDHEVGGTTHRRE
jgi:predicted metal-dependent HD superfamily phosphohydrolase